MSPAINAWADWIDINRDFIESVDRPFRYGERDLKDRCARDLIEAATWEFHRDHMRWSRVETHEHGWELRAVEATPEAYDFVRLTTRMRFPP